MLSIGTVIFREFFEIFLIITIMVRSLPKFSGKNYCIASGVTLGSIFAVILTYFFSDIDQSFGGLGQEVANSITLFVTAIFVAMTVIWMNKNAFKTKSEISKLSQDISNGNKTKISLIFAITMLVLREGSEIAIFISSYISIKEYSLLEITFASFGGFAFAILISILIYSGIASFMQKYIFKVTNVLMCIIVANMMSKSAMYLSAANIIPDSEPIWLLSQSTDPAIIIKTLSNITGFISGPTLIEFSVFAITLGFMAFTVLFHNARKI